MAPAWIDRVAPSIAVGPFATFVALLAVVPNYVGILKWKASERCYPDVVVKNHNEAKKSEERESVPRGLLGVACVRCYHTHD